MENCVYAGLIRVPAFENSPERYVKGKHTGIISEADFWLTQTMLKSKRPSKTRAKDEVPLRGILKCGCGLSMTSGWSKGKKKYYLYYRCTKHHGTNIPAEKLHDEWCEILSMLSLKQSQVDQIIKSSKRELSIVQANIVERIREKQGELKIVEEKIERLEEKMMNDEIESATYKKWFGKFSGEKAYLVGEIKRLNGDTNEKWKKVLELLPLLLDVPALFEMAGIEDQHTLVREVFKHGLTYSGGKCRTPSINPAFAHNALKIKEKGLLFFEQSLPDLSANPMCT